MESAMATLPHFTTIPIATTVASSASSHILFSQSPATHSNPSTLKFLHRSAISQFSHTPPAPRSEGALAHLASIFHALLGLVLASQIASRELAGLTTAQELVKTSWD